MLIDIHTHIYPRSLIERLKREPVPPRVICKSGVEHLDIFINSGESTQPITDSFESVSAKLAFMDQHGIAASILSIGNPWVDFMESSEAVQWAAALNEELETICARHPGRLYAFGVLPLQDPSGAVRELERIQRSPHLYGAVVSAKPAGGYIDDPALEPVWKKAADIGLPLMIHPHFTVGGDDLAGHGVVLNLVYGFTFETTVAATRLILSGVLDRYPSLKLILAHAGGALPFLAGRLEQFAGARLPQRVREYLSRFYYDAVAYHTPALRCALETVGDPRRFMFGSDHPFGPPNPATWRAMVAALGLFRADEQAIYSETARCLFGLDSRG